MSAELLTGGQYSLRNFVENIGTQAGVDRCYLCSFDMATDTLDMEFEWVKDGVTPFQETLRNVSKDLVPTLISRVLTGEAVIISDVETELAGTVDLEELRNEDIKSIILLPICRDSGDMIGFIGFDCLKGRTWNDEEMRYLEIFRDVTQAFMRHPDVFFDFPWKGKKLKEAAPSAELFETLTEDDRLIVEQIVVEFEKIRRASEIRDEWESIGKRGFMNKLAEYVSHKDPILMILPAFPMKAPTLKKVTGVLPDLGEVLALARLNSFGKTVEKIYPHGCRMLVVSDGRVFNDLYPVDDDHVSKYNEVIHGMFRNSNMRFIGLDQLFPTLGNKEKRDAIIKIYGKDIEAVKRKIDEDDHFRQIYVVFKSLLMNDIGIKKVQAGPIAKLMMLRNDGYNSLIQILFNGHIRLSIHDHSGVTKIGVHLVGKSVLTPWHGVAAKLESGEWTILRREDAEGRGMVQYDALKQPELLAEAGLAHLDLTMFDALPFYQHASEEAIAAA